MALITFIFLICSLRVNVTLLLSLIFLIIAFFTLAGTYFHLAVGNVAMAGRLQIVSALSHSCIWSFDPNTDSLSKTGGAFTFALSLCVWYLLQVQMLEAVDFPINLPVGNLTVIILGRSIKALKREHED